MRNRIINFLEKINKTSLYAAIFLTPLFFIPFSYDTELPKHMLLIFLLMISFVSWALRQLLLGDETEINIKKNNVFFLAIFFLLLSSGLSAAYSLSASNSLWGLSPNLGESFASLALFAAMAFLIANSFKDETGPIFSFKNEKGPVFILKLLISSGALAAIIAIFQSYNVFIFPFEITHSPLFGVAGPLSAVAIMSGALLPLSLYFIFTNSGFWKTIFSMASLVFAFALILIDFNIAWGLLAVEAIILIIFAPKINKKNNFAWAGALMIVLSLCIFFLFFPLRFGFLPEIPVEISPSIITEINILRQSFGQAPKNIFLGTGSGTFVFNYSAFRSPAINQTVFWGNRFYKGSSTILDWIITHGIIGGAFLCLLLGWVVFGAVKKLIRIFQGKEECMAGAAFFASAIGLIVAGLFYSFNFIIWFIFWAYCGIILFYLTEKREEKINLVIKPYKIGVFMLIFVVLIVSGLSAAFFQTRRYLADINYFQGMKKAQANNLDAAIAHLNRAKSFNSKNDVYWRELGQLHLVKADVISRDREINPQEQRQLIFEAIVRGTEAVNSAVAMGPANVANWNVRGYFYRNLIGIEGAGELALESYGRAIELEPASPFAYGEMGRVYILIAQGFGKIQEDEKKEEAFLLARENLNKALELKPDYAPSHYLLAVIYDQKGKIDDAIQKLQQIKASSPHDSGIVFQLGLLYWRKGEIENAKKEFQRSIELIPEYSNARYMLGLVYDRQGKPEQARKEFQRVAELNPQNQEIKKILENIKNGLPALEGVIMPEPPIQEEPPEIKT